MPSRISNQLYFSLPQFVPGTTSTFLHDFNFLARLQHSGRTSTSRHDFNVGSFCKWLQVPQFLDELEQLFGQDLTDHHFFLAMSICRH